MKVLLSAYQCGPGMGSVSQIGWEWYSRLCRKMPVTLFTHVRNRAALENAGAPLPGSAVHYIDTEWFAGPLFALASRLFPRSEHSVFLVSSLDFFPYESALRRKAKRLLRRSVGWDIVHAVTPVSPSAISRLHKLGAPVVLGPWNGGMQSPKTFPDLMSQDSGWLYRIRDLGRMLDRIFGCTRYAARIWAANQTTVDAIPAAYRNKSTLMLENGVDLSLFEPTPWPENPGPGRPLKVLFVGRLIPVKGVNFMLEAASRLGIEIPLEITIAGDGPMREPWTKLAASLGVTGQVRFLGACSLSEVAKLHRASHVFCLPSVRESGGAVLLEAMASARPIIAVDYGGPAVVTDASVGRALPADGPESVTAALVETFRDIVRDPEGWRNRGIEGRRRAERFYSWDAKIEAAMDAYQELQGAQT